MRPAKALLDVDVWEELAACDDAEVAAAAAKLAAFVRGEGALDGLWDVGDAPAGAGFDPRGEGGLASPAQRASVEFAHLFVGPPKPAVAPWETFYRQQGCAVGFGEATYAMRAALRDNGLELAQAGRQYEDHMGIELLLASELCRRAGAEQARAERGAGTKCASPSPAERAADFVRSRPLAWMPAFRQAVEQECPNGFYAPLLHLAQALLEMVA